MWLVYNKSIPKIPVVNGIPPWLWKVPMVNFELPGKYTKKDSEFLPQMSALELISERYEEFPSYVYRWFFK